MDDLLRHVPIRLRQIPMPNEETVSAVATDISKGILERVFCMNRRDEFRSAIKDVMDRAVADYVKRTGDNSVEESMSRFVLSEKDITDLQLAFLLNSPEDDSEIAETEETGEEAGDE